MKKTLLCLFLSICAVAALVGATIVMSGKGSEAEQDVPRVQSEEYEVVEFVAPDKTVYSMSDFDIAEMEGEDGTSRLVQILAFDYTGMRMTVRSKKTGKTKEYEYKCYNFELDGKVIKCEDRPFMLEFYADADAVLAPGEYTAEATLITTDGQCVVYQMPFTLVADTEHP